LLVETIDRPFHSSNFGVAHVRATSNIFFVPELEVEAMLRTDDALKTRVGIVNVFVVPPSNGVGL